MGAHQSFSIQLTPEAIRDAPKVWVPNGKGVRVKVVDPKWRQKMENAHRLAEIENLEARRQAAVKARQQELADEFQALDREAAEAKRQGRIRDWYSAANLALEQDDPESRHYASSVLSEMAALYGYTVEDIRGKARHLYLARARQHIIYEVARICHHLSYPQIGRIFDRDHSTIIHAVKVWPKKAAELGLDAEPLPRRMHLEDAE